MVKLGQMEASQFERLRQEIIGGDLKDVHLVKGLDFALLERVRRGEDVYSEKPKTSSVASAVPANEDETPEVDVDEEFEKLEDKEVTPVIKQEKPNKKGDMPPPGPVTGQKRTRDDILKQLRASRAAAIEEAKARQPKLPSRFTKLGVTKGQARIERDDRGREVLITVDAEGNVKRKVKKSKSDDNAQSGLLMPDKDVAPLGIEVPTAPAPAVSAEEEDGDIFADVGKEYDPLADIDDSDDSDSESSKSGNENTNGGDDTTKTAAVQSSTDSRAKASPSPRDSGSASPPNPKSNDQTSMPPPPLPSKPISQATKPRNYFSTESSNETLPTTSTDTPSSSTTTNFLKDPTIAAAIKKASTMQPLTSASTSDSKDPSAKPADQSIHHRLLNTHDRDMEDIDMGFGSSRFADDEDAEEDAGGGGKKLRLSVWGEDDKDGSNEKGRGGQQKQRKRGPKKKKGDKDSVSDVLGVLSRRKGEK